MRKFIVKITISLFSLFVYTSSIYGKETLVFSKSNDPVANISEEVLKEAYERIGITITTLVLPAERSLRMSNFGTTDGEINRIDGIENTYSNLKKVAVSVNILEGIVFTKDLKIKITDWNSLKPYKIGIRRGSKFAERGTKGMRVETVTSNEQLFRMLNNGRNDIVVTTRLEGLNQINRLQLKEVFIIEPPLVTLNLYHYLHKKNLHLLPKIESVLHKMESEGRIKIIRQKIIDNLIKKSEKYE